jgi:hypothetical protein
MRSAIEREKKQARGIVIRHGVFARERSAFWAYLWSEELLADEALPTGRSDESDQSDGSDGLALARAHESRTQSDRQTIRL